MSRENSDGLGTPAPGGAGAFARISPGAVPATSRPAVPALLAALVVVGLALLVEARAPLRDDVAWLIYLAENWLDGGRPYGDLVEVNPPTAIWISMLPVLLSRGLGIAVMTLTPFFYATAVLACAWLTAGVLRRRGVFADRAATFAALAITLTLLPLSEFGEREHLIAAFALPYLALHAGKAPTGAGGRGAPGRGDALLAGLLAGVCVGMKPHYALPFVLATGWAMFSGGRPPWRATLAAAATVLALALATVLFTPDYLDRAVPLALRFYAPVPSTPMLPLAAMPAVAALGGAAVLWWAHRRRPQDGGTTGVLLAFALGSWIVYLIQYKGFFYQRIPGTVATFLALLAWTFTARRLPARRGAHLAAAVLLLLGAAVHPLVRVGMRAALAADPDARPEARMIEYLRDRGARSYVAYTYYLSWGFPLVQTAGVSWGSRFVSTWALRAEQERLAREPGQPGDEPAADHLARRWMVEDFLNTCPELVAVAGDEGMDYLALLAADGPAFTRAWAHYRPFAEINQFRVYARPRGSTGPSVCGREAAPVGR